MRRQSLVLMVTILLAGCSSFSELFSAQADVAAKARGQELKAERMAEILAGAQGTQANPDVAQFVANLWVDLTLFSQAVASGEFKADSATVAKIMWPQIVDRRIASWRDSLIARRPSFDSSAVDAAYGSGNVRIFQHILVSPKGSTAADSAAALRQTEQVLARIRGGTSFASQAGALNEDATRQDGGFLPPSGRGAFVPEFENAAWELAPGEVSGVVQSGFGYHLIRRPPLSEVRERLVGWVVQNEGSRADSLYMNALAEKRGLKVRDGAGSAIKAALEDIHGSQKSSKVLVDLEGGPLTVGLFSRWMTALQPGQVAQIRQQPDSNLAFMARLLAQQILLERQADSAGVQIDVADWTALQLSVNAGTSQLIAEMGLNAPEVADSTRPVEERRAAAAQKVDDFFTRLLAGQAQLRPLPGVLGSMLRQESSYRVNQAGLTRALELAMVKARADSAAAASQPQPGVVQPAPGGPPVPGGEGN